MNWDKAKNLTIVFLVILNFFLLGLVYTTGRGYVLTAEQQSAILAVLAGRGVSVNAQIPASHRPMESIRIAPASYDTQTMLDVFFAHLPLGSEIIRMTESGQIIFIHTHNAEVGQRLTISEAGVLFENFLDDDLIIDVRGFVARNSGVFPGYVFDGQFEDNSLVTITYRQQYRGHLFYSNFVSFTKENGVLTKIQYVHNELLNFDSNPKNILSADEALFAFLLHPRVQGRPEVVINRMDIVYFQENIVGDEETLIKAHPAYRFYIEGDNEAILIDATTGEVELNGHS